MNQPQRFYKTLLCGRARGDQPLRTNPPRPPKEDGLVLIEITRLSTKSEQELFRYRFASASHLLAKALKLANTLDTRDEKLIDELASCKRTIDKRIEKIRRRESQTVPQPIFSP